jgi:hypothetical protein
MASSESVSLELLEAFRVGDGVNLIRESGQRSPDPAPGKTSRKPVHAPGDGSAVRWPGRGQENGAQQAPALARERPAAPPTSEPSTTRSAGETGSPRR